MLKHISFLKKYVEVGTYTDFFLEALAAYWA